MAWSTMLENLSTLKSTTVLLALIAIQSSIAEPAADWSRLSQYVSVRDGTQIAVDCYLPRGVASDGEAVVQRPVVFRYTPYGRRLLSTSSHEIPDSGLGINGSETIERFIRRGYVFCVADARGYGASFGHRTTWLGEQDAYDVRDVTDWLASQPWSNAKIGMVGSSWLGSIQYWTLVDPSKHLKALFVGMAQYDHYETFFDNGIYRQDLVDAWEKVRRQIDFATTGTGVAPVDGEEGQARLGSARSEHQFNIKLGEQIQPLRFREDAEFDSGNQWHLKNSVWFYAKPESANSVAKYHVAGWWDAYSKAQLLAYTNFVGPQKLHIGPYFHNETFGIDLIGEALRWFDYWLMDIDNGIMAEPPIRLYRVGADWEQHEEWVALGNQALQVSLGSDMQWIPDHSNAFSSSDSVNNGFLERNNGNFRQGICDDVLAPPSICYAFPSLREMRLPSNTSTKIFSLALNQDLYLTGHPTVSLWTSALQSDVEISMVLALDEGTGQPRYISSASMLASYQVPSTAPINNLGLPWLNQRVPDASTNPSDPMHLQLDLKPIAAQLPAGSTLILMITATQPTLLENKKAVPFEIYQREGFESRLRLPLGKGAQL